MTQTVSENEWISLNFSQFRKKEENQQWNFIESVEYCSIQLRTRLMASVCFLSNIRLAIEQFAIILR